MWSLIFVVVRGHFRRDEIGGGGGDENNLIVAFKFAHRCKFGENR